MQTVVCKLDITPACQAGGHGFEPRPPRQTPAHRKVRGLSRSGALLALSLAGCPTDFGVAEDWEGGPPPPCFEAAQAVQRQCTHGTAEPCDVFATALLGCRHEAESGHTVCWQGRWDRHCVAADPKGGAS